VIVTLETCKPVSLFLGQLGSGVDGGSMVGGGGGNGVARGCMVAAAGWLLEDKHVNSTVSLDIIGLRGSTTNLT